MTSDSLRINGVTRYTKQYFERISSYACKGGYERMRNEVISFYQANLEYFRSLVPQIFYGNGRKVLDVGCGLGYGLEVLDALGYDSYGCDVSRYAIEKAQKKFSEKKRDSFIELDVQEPYILSSNFSFKFSVITCFEVLEHLEKSENFIRNAYRVLHMGGYFLASTPNPLSLSPFRLMQNDPTHINERPPDKWKKGLEKAGFRYVHVRTLHLLPLVHRFLKRKFFVRMPLRFGYKTVILAKK